MAPDPNWLKAETWWVVRAEGGKLLDSKFVAQSVIAIGSDTPRVDLSDASTPEALADRFRSAGHGGFVVTRNRFAHICDFVCEMRAGHVVITPSKDHQDIVVRSVAGGYRFVPDDPHGLHVQRTMHLGKRRTLTPELKEMLRHPQDTIFRLADDRVAAFRQLAESARPQST